MGDGSGASGTIGSDMSAARAVAIGRAHVKARRQQGKKATSEERAFGGSSGFLDQILVGQRQYVPDFLPCCLLAFVYSPSVLLERALGRAARFRTRRVRRAAAAARGAGCGGRHGRVD